MNSIATFSFQVLDDVHGVISPRHAYEASRVSQSLVHTVNTSEAVGAAGAVEHELGTIWLRTLPVSGEPGAIGVVGQLFFCKTEAELVELDLLELNLLENVSVTLAQASPGWVKPEPDDDE
jgi:hypothetical protein